MRIITICGCGLGTCFILKLTTENVLKELGLKAEVIHCDLGSAVVMDCDFFVAPVGLENQLKNFNKRYVGIRNIASTAELKEKIVPLLENYLK